MKAGGLRFDWDRTDPFISENGWDFYVDTGDEEGTGTVGYVECGGDKFEAGGLYADWKFSRFDIAKLFIEVVCVDRFLSERRAEWGILGRKCFLK